MSVEDELLKQAKALKAIENSTLKDMFALYDDIERALLKDVERFTKALELSDNPSIGSLYRLERSQNLLGQVNTQLTSFAEQAKPLLNEATSEATRLGIANAEDLIGMNLDAVGVFDRLPISTIDTIARTTRIGPLNELLASFGDVAQARARTTLVKGLALGYNPRKIASELRYALGVNRSRAETIARTEILRAHREASRQTYKQHSDVVKGWVWHAACDARTCAACFAMHGTEFSVNEPMKAHVMCRCAMLPKTKTWAELGYTNIKETSIEVPSGESVFDRASPRLQEQVLGPKAYDAYKKGEVALPNFVRVSRSAKWGDSYVRGSLDYATSRHREQKEG